MSCGIKCSVTLSHGAGGKGGCGGGGVLCSVLLIVVFPDHTHLYCIIASLDRIPSKNKASKHNKQISIT